MNASVIRFGLLFFSFLLAFSALSVATALQNRLLSLESSIATSAAWMASALGSRAEVVNNHFISVGGMTLNINHECTGVFVLFVLISFIAAYPSSLKTKVLGISVGVTLLSFINVIRIATLVRVIEFYPTSFEYFHEYVWQGAFLMLVTIYAITWVEWSRR